MMKFLFGFVHPCSFDIAGFEVGVSKGGESMIWQVPSVVVIDTIETLWGDCIVGSGNPGRCMDGIVADAACDFGLRGEADGK